MGMGHTVTLFLFACSEPVGSLLGPCISRHFNNKQPGCLDATIKIGIPLTVFRLWVQDGRYHLLVLEGRSVAPRRHILGNNGLVELDNGLNLDESFPRWVASGFPHHVCVVEGRWRPRFLDLAHNCGVVVVN